MLAPSPRVIKEKLRLLKWENGTILFTIKPYVLLWEFDKHDLEVHYGVCFRTPTREKFYKITGDSPILFLGLYKPTPNTPGKYLDDGEKKEACILRFLCKDKVLFLCSSALSGGIGLDKFFTIYKIKKGAKNG